VADNGGWSVFKRILSGKPAFEGGVSTQGGSEAAHSTNDAHASSGYLQSSGKKVYPVVRISKCDFHRAGDHAELRVDVHNESPFEIELDKLRALGVTTELDTRLQPHGSREFLVYRGHALHNQPQGKAELVYKIMGNGDYFMHPHDYVTQRESDGVYLITELRGNTSLITDV